ncbi:EAL domain-containing protein [Lysinibacillus odysseyi]|uniref:Diguanylate cyclase n=1 Tax=Lysinibacillus odysseyi 34hs-1 = NBRC 100172 TaxID=1220589 RepID=A0A0A3IPN8_9BACI|nr:EAL domain-containing protein [Lysinibacillus odysseyi]KGR84798.1 hypothetical protein CD32_10070 [Lysinibacillus odysseyi 34hs-1 = NBRC 100172]
MEGNRFLVPNKELLYLWLCRLAKKVESGVVILDADSLLVKYVNEYFTHITEYSREEIVGGKINMLSEMLTEKKHIEELEEVLEAGTPIKRRLFQYRKDGSGFWGDITVIPFSADEKKVQFYFFVINDVTEVVHMDTLVQLERKLYLSLEKDYQLSHVFEQICDYVSTSFYRPNKCSIFLVEGNRLQILTQSTIPEDLKKSLNNLDISRYMGDEKTSRFLREPVLSSNIQEHEGWSDFHWVLKKYQFVASWSQPIKNHQGETVGIFAVYFEEPITPRPSDYMFLDRLAPIVTLALKYFKQKSEILKLAFYDERTGLRNIASFEKEMAHIGGQRESGVIYIMEATEHQYIVDLYGRVGGDALLKQLADRLGAIPGFQEAIIARYTSSSIIVAILNEDPNQEILLPHINELTFEPYMIDGKNVSITLKIGAAIFEGEVTGTMAIQHADTALFSASKLPGTVLHLYEESQRHSIEKELEVLTLFASALKNKEFFPMLQPKVDIQTREIIGFEALARWESAEIGFVSPAIFIPVGEKTGNIHKVDRAILKSVLAWQRERKKQGKRLFPVAVNISANHFYYPDFVENIEKLIKEYEMDPKYLILEITESIELENVSYAKRNICQLRDIGIATSMDDFGVGYSSLSYLQELPFEEIKIDKSFTDSIAEPRMHAVVKTIIQLAADLEMKSVAEGVETEAQHQELKKIGCNIGQGYYYYKPMKLEEVDLLLLQYEEDRG